DAFVLGDVRGGLAEEKALALGGEEQAEQQLDGGRLAGTVGPEQAEDFALADLHGEGAQGGLLLSAPEVAVYLGELARLNDDIMGHGPAPRQRNQSGSPIRVIHPSTQRARQRFTRSGPVQSRNVSTTSKRSVTSSSKKAQNRQQTPGSTWRTRASCSRQRAHQSASAQSWPDATTRVGTGGWGRPHSSGWAMKDGSTSPSGRPALRRYWGNGFSPEVESMGAARAFAYDSAASLPRNACKSLA